MLNRGKLISPSAKKKFTISPERVGTSRYIKKFGACPYLHGNFGWLDVCCPHPVADACIEGRETKKRKKEKEPQTYSMQNKISLSRDIRCVCATPR